MSQERRKQDQSDQEKVGSSPDAARGFAEESDFGIPAERALPDRGRVGDRTDEGTHARSGQQGVRDSGVSSKQASPGHGSGGDADPDIIGVGTQGGSTVGNSGNLGKTDGPDMTTEGGGAPFASGPPAQGKNTKQPGTVGGKHSVEGTTHNAAVDATQGGGGTGVGYRDEPGQRKDRAEAIDPTIHQGAQGGAGAKERQTGDREVGRDR